tara:strand:- start:3334 stop:3603 length:270 start_codon:yes stop_codon:yes gene_type:complete
MAVLRDEASFVEFSEYVLARRDVPLRELRELYERRLRLKSITVHTGEAYRKTLPVDERHLTNREREAKVFAEAKSQGRNIEKLPEKAQF